MTITRQNLERLALAEMQEFLAGSRSIAFANQGREQIYRFVERVLAAQHYRRLGKEAEGHREAVSSAAERVESGPVDAADGSVASAPTDRGPTTPPAPLSAPLHTPGHCLVSGRRRCPRGSVGAGGTAHPRARVAVVRQLGVRPPGPNLGLPHPQPAALEGLPLASGGAASHPGAAGRHRRAAQTRSPRTTDYLRIDTVHSAPRPLGGPPGSVSRQHCRYGHLWHVVGCVKTISERHLVPVLKAMLHPVPLSSERLPLRQRLGVPESPRGPGITGERTRA